MTGQIDILNCSLGHNAITVDASNPVELERGARIIQDMLKRGYALFVHGKDNELIRIQAFDPDQKVYIIGAEANLTDEAAPVAAPVPTAKGKPGRKKLPMTAAKVTAIGRSAGG